MFLGYEITEQSDIAFLAYCQKIPLNLGRLGKSVLHGLFSYSSNSERLQVF